MKNKIHVDTPEFHLNYISINELKLWFIMTKYHNRLTKVIYEKQNKN